MSPRRQTADVRRSALKYRKRHAKWLKHHRKHKLTANQKKAIRLKVATGFFKKIAKLRESLQLQEVCSEKTDPKTIHALIEWAAEPAEPEEQRSVRDFIKTLLNQEPEYARSDTGLAALQFEHWMASEAKEIFARFVETEVAAGEKTFLAIFEGQFSPDDWNKLRQETESFVSLEILIEAGTLDPVAGMVSDVTVLEGAPRGTQIKPKFNKDGKADELSSNERKNLPESFDSKYLEAIPQFRPSQISITSRGAVWEDPITHLTYTMNGDRWYQEGTLTETEASESGRWAIASEGEGICAVTLLNKDSKDSVTYYIEADEAELSQGIASLKATFQGEEADDAITAFLIQYGINEGVRRLGDVVVEHDGEGRDVVGTDPVVSRKGWAYYEERTGERAGFLADLVSKARGERKSKGLLERKRAIRGKLDPKSYDDVSRFQGKLGTDTSDNSAQTESATEGIQKVGKVGRFDVYQNVTEARFYPVIHHVGLGDSPVIGQGKGKKDAERACDNAMWAHAQGHHKSHFVGMIRAKDHDEAVTKLKARDFEKVHKDEKGFAKSTTESVDEATAHVSKYGILTVGDSGVHTVLAHKPDHEHIKAVADGSKPSHSFKDDTGTRYTVKRDGDDVHFHAPLRSTIKIHHKHVLKALGESVDEGSLEKMRLNNVASHARTYGYHTALAARQKEAGNHDRAADHEEAAQIAHAKFKSAAVGTRHEKDITSHPAHAVGTTMGSKHDLTMDEAVKGKPAGGAKGGRELFWCAEKDFHKGWKVLSKVGQGLSAAQAELQALTDKDDGTYGFVKAHDYKTAQEKASQNQFADWDGDEPWMLPASEAYTVSGVGQDKPILWEAEAPKVAAALLKSTKGNVSSAIARLRLHIKQTGPKLNADTRESLERASTILSALIEAKDPHGLATLGTEEHAPANVVGKRLYVKMRHLPGKDHLPHAAKAAHQWAKAKGYDPTKHEQGAPEKHGETHHATTFVYSHKLAGKTDEASELAKGKEEEKEHTSPEQLAKLKQKGPSAAATQIAKDHLKEKPDYYSRLEKAGLMGEALDAFIDEVAPPGWSGTVKKMKAHKEISNPFALAWALKKRGAKPHYKPEDIQAAADATGQPISEETAKAICEIVSLAVPPYDGANEVTMSGAVGGFRSSGADGSTDRVSGGAGLYSDTKGKNKEMVKKALDQTKKVSEGAVKDLMGDRVEATTDGAQLKKMHAFARNMSNANHVTQRGRTYYAKLQNRIAKHAASLGHTLESVQLSQADEAAELAFTLLEAKLKEKETSKLTLVPGADFTLEDVQLYYDMLLVQCMDEDDATELVMEKFKLKDFGIGPTGIVHSKDFPDSTPPVSDPSGMPQPGFGAQGQPGQDGQAAPMAAGTASADDGEPEADSGEQIHVHLHKGDKAAKKTTKESTEEAVTVAASKRQSKIIGADAKPHKPTTSAMFGGTTEADLDGKRKFATKEQADAFKAAEAKSKTNVSTTFDAKAGLSEAAQKLSDEEFRKFFVPRKSFVVDHVWWTIKDRDLDKDSATIVTSEYALKDGHKLETKRIAYSDIQKNINSGKWGGSTPSKGHIGHKQNPAIRAAFRKKHGRRAAPGFANEDLIDALQNNSDNLAGIVERDVALIQKLGCRFGAACDIAATLYERGGTKDAPLAAFLARSLGEVRNPSEATLKTTVSLFAESVKGSVDESRDPVEIGTRLLSLATTFKV